MPNLKVQLPRTLSWRFGVVVLLLAVLSLLLGVETAQDTNRNTRCLAEYSARQAEVAEARAAASKAENDAEAALLTPLVKVILEVTRPDPEGTTRAEAAELRAAAQEYRRATRLLAQERAANPLPQFPVQCSEANE